MSTILLHLAHQALFGALAAVGFGLLFNIAARNLVRCALLGALALTLRTMCLDAGWNLEAATFAAALATATAVYLPAPRFEDAPNLLALAGAIAMVPGAFFEKALLGFLALTVQTGDLAATTMTESVIALLRVIFTLGALGAGLSIPAQFHRMRKAI